MKTYIVSGLEFFHRSNYQLEPERFRLNPVEVFAPSPKDAHDRGAILLQEQITNTNHTPGYRKTYTSYLQVNEVREAIQLSENLPALISFDLPSEIIALSQDASRNMIEHLSRHPDTLKTINRRVFEEIVAQIWKGFGYDVELTGATRDGGKDIIAISRSIVSQKFLIECKRPDPGNKIGVAPVRELFGVKISEGATKAIMVTTSYFTHDAKLLFDKHKWELEGKDYDGLVKWIEHYVKPVKNKGINMV